MLGQVLRYLRQISTRLNIAAGPPETRCNISRSYGFDDIGKIARIQSAQQSFSLDRGYTTIAKRYQLLERSERIAHPALRAVRNQIERIAFVFHAFHLTDRAETADELLGGYATKIETLTP